MKKKYKVAPEVRQEFLNRIKNEGLSVAQAAKDAGVSETTVYGWLGKGAESVPSILELAKLKRENKELLELVGELTLKLSTAQKKKEMIGMAKKRGLKPQYVLMDAWFTSIDNLKAIDAYGWKWIGEIKCNRLVSVKKGEYVRVEHLDWTSKQDHRVWLKAYGFIVVSKLVAPNGDIAYIATNDLPLDDRETIQNRFVRRWAIETFPRGLKQCCGIERWVLVQELLSNKRWPMGSCFTLGYFS
jgi:transposase